MALILVVEDDPEINSLMALTLRVEDYDVMQARDGFQALKLIEERAPDLILLDVMMPRMSGYDVARELQDKPATANIPIIFVTAKSEMEDRVRGLEMAIDYVCKPFAAPELIARVRVALRLKKLQEELRTSNEQLAQLATTDSLTGLCNRRQFNIEIEDELQRARRYKSPLALLMFDLDYFKNVNDTYGHAQGDLVLRAFGDLLNSTKRRIDIVARLGGEEFAALLPATDLDGAREFAERLRLAVAQQQFPVSAQNDETIGVTVSAGVAVIEHPEYAPEDDELINNLIHQERATASTDTAAITTAITSKEVGTESTLSPLARELMSVADSLLYRAKAEGRNRVVAGPVEWPGTVPHREIGR